MFAARLTSPPLGALWKQQRAQMGEHAGRRSGSEASNRTPLATNCIDCFFGTRIPFIRQTMTQGAQFWRRTT